MQVGIDNAGAMAQVSTSGVAGQKMSQEEVKKTSQSQVLDTVTISDTAKEMFKSASQQDSGGGVEPPKLDGNDAPKNTVAPTETQEYTDRGSEEPLRLMSGGGVEPPRRDSGGGVEPPKP